MYTVIEISEYLDKSVSQIYNTVHQLKIQPDKCIKRINHYNTENLFKIKEWLARIPENIKYYPLKTTETFYIYESKINNQ